MDPQGGVFVPVPGKPITVAYSIGPKVGKGAARDVMFQCPVSAIPDEVWILLNLWWQCRLMGLPPKPGGFLDQPLMVRRSFPFFEMEWRQVERGDRLDSGQLTAAAAVAGVVKAMGR